MFIDGRRKKGQNKVQAVQRRENCKHFILRLRKGEQGSLCWPNTHSLSSSLLSSLPLSLPSCWLQKSPTTGTELNSGSPLTLCYCWHDHRRCGRHHSCHCNCTRNRWWRGTAVSTAATGDQRGLWCSYNNRWLLSCGRNDWCWYKLSDCCIVMGFGENVGHEGWTWWCGHYNNLKEEK